METQDGAPVVRADPESALRVCPDGRSSMRVRACSVVLATVLIVDDHAEFRSVARRLLQRSDFQVVGEAADGSSGRAAVRLLRPDVVLLDIQLPDMDGCELCRALAAEPEAPRIVLISSRDASDYGVRLAGCGALGFVAKADLSVAALDAILEGRR
jgi:DNA-binding NarL/FixJ family response regulator